MELGKVSACLQNAWEDVRLAQFRSAKLRALTAQHWALLYVPAHTGNCRFSGCGSAMTPAAKKAATNEKRIVVARSNDWLRWVDLFCKECLI